eukprot:2910338-Pyramimonas_sp.AAC.1
MQFNDVPADIEGVSGDNSNLKEKKNMDQRSATCVELQIGPPSCQRLHYKTNAHGAAARAPFSK